MKTKKISIIGLGYIGLPTAVVLANKGYEVSGFDINSNIVSTINRGNVHIVEPDLETLLRSAISKGKLKAFKRPQPADIYIISVPTPLYDNDPDPIPNLSLEMNSFISDSKKLLGRLKSPSNLEKNW